MSADREAALAGRLVAVGAGICFGTLGLFSKLFYAHGGRSSELLTIRMVGGVVLLGAIAAVRRRPIPRRARPLVLLALALGGFQAATNYALLEGYSRAPAALIVLLFYVYPLIVALLAAPLFGEELGRRKLVAIALGLVGIALTVGTPSHVPAVGIILGLVAGVSTAGYVLGARRVMRSGEVGPTQTAALMLVGPAVGFSLATATHGFAPLSEGAVWSALALVLVATVAAPFLFFSAIERIGAGTTSLLATVEPFVTVLLAFVVLHESLTAIQLCGGAFILAAVTALSLPVRMPSAAV